MPSARPHRGSATFRPSPAACYNHLEVALLYLERIPAAPLNQYIRAL